MDKGFRGLIVWQKGYDLVLDIYKVTKTFPKEELYGLTSQIRRASISVIANISEGYEREYRKQYVQFLLISKGSLGEIEAYLVLLKDLNYIDQPTFNRLESKRKETAMVLRGLIISIKNKNNPASGPSATGN